MALNASIVSSYNAHWQCAWSIRMQERVKKPKRAVNLSIDAELLAAAKESELNLSAVLEAALRTELQERRWQKWRDDNREATESMNRYIEQHGLPLKKYRSW